MAKHDWILSLDADEAIDEELKRSLLALQLTDEQTVYEIKYKNFLGNKHLQYGEWGNDKHTRLFNRKRVNWDDAPVHEQLVVPRDVNKKNCRVYFTQNDEGYKRLCC